MKSKEKKITDALNESLEDLQKSQVSEVDREIIIKRANFYYRRFMSYGYDDKEPYNLKTISWYCAKLYSGAVTKGLCLVGGTGLGKTFAFKIMQNLFRMRIYHAADIVDLWQNFGVKNRYELYDMLKGNYSDRGQPEIDRLWRDCCIDDIGVEPCLNEYGTKQEVLDTIIQKRTREFEDTGARTHMAINLTPEKIKERYGARFESRLHQICYVITLRGQDRRKDK